MGGAASVDPRMCVFLLVFWIAAPLGLGNAQEVRTSCPGYRPGSPAGRNFTGCETGLDLGPVDHVRAFGFNTSHNPDWTSCVLPDHELPEANHRKCFRTTVDKCGEEYRIFLKRRNSENLKHMCPHESDELHLHGPDNENRTVELQSPRYGCRKQRSGNLYAYRKSDLCLYNISIPRCESNILTLEGVFDDTQELEDRADNGVCKDYLQFYYGSTKTETYCGNELLSLELTIPATQFMAVFWTDPADNKLGFKLSARCQLLILNK